MLSRVLETLAPEVPHLDRHPSGPETRLFILAAGVKWPRTFRRREVIESMSPSTVGGVEIRRFAIRDTLFGLERYQLIDYKESSFPWGASLCRIVRLDQQLITLDASSSEVASTMRCSSSPLQLSRSPSLGCYTTDNSPATSDDSADDAVGPCFMSHVAGLSLHDVYDAIHDRIVIYATDVVSAWQRMGETTAFSLSHRRKIVDTAEEVVHYFNGSPLSVHFAVSYLDRAIGARPDYGNSGKELRCVVVCCALIACKNLEPELPASHTIARTLNDIQISSNHLQEFELHVLSALRFKLQPVTLLEMVDLFITVCAREGTLMESVCHLLADIILRKEEFLQWPVDVNAITIVRFAALWDNEGIDIVLLKFSKVPASETVRPLEVLLAAHRDGILFSDLPTLVRTRHADALSLIELHPARSLNFV